MDVRAIYYGSIPIVEAYLGRELVFTQDLGVLRPIFLVPLQSLIETMGEAEMVSGSSEPLAVDSDALSFVFEDTLLNSRPSEPAKPEGDMEFMSESKGFAGPSAPADPLDEIIEITNETEGNTGAAAPGVCDESLVETSGEAQTDTGLAQPMEGDALVESYFECMTGMAESRPASGEATLQIEAEVTVIALTLSKFADGVLYIPTAYSATLNDGILEVS